MFTTFNRNTGQILAIRDGQGRGDYHLSEEIGVLQGAIPSSMYVNLETGIIEPRIPVAIRFSKPEAMDGTVVDLLDVPADALVMYRGEITDARQFTVSGRSLGVSLVGKYDGCAICERLTEDILVDREIRELMREKVRQRIERGEV